MAQKSWTFVDSRVRPGDVLCFVVVWTYLLVVCAYLVATRQIRSGISWRDVARRLTAWPRAAFRKVRPRPDAQHRRAA